MVSYRHNSATSLIGDEHHVRAALSEEDVAIITVAEGCAFVVARNRWEGLVITHAGALVSVAVGGDAAILRRLKGYS